MLSRTRVRHFQHSPCFVSIEPANYCQLHCPECEVGVNGRPVELRRCIDKAKVESILHDVSDYAHTVQFFFQGEPTINPELPDMIAMAHDLKLVTIVSTNAQLLDRRLARRLVRAGLDKIIVSVDGLTQQTYQQYRRGGQLQRALDALRFLAEEKQAVNSAIEIEMQCLKLKTNQGEWMEFRRVYRRLGATRLNLKTAQISSNENLEMLLPDGTGNSRYIIDAKGTPVLRHKLRRRCLRLWRGCVVTTDGAMLPCCFDKTCRYPFGNVFTHGIHACWTSNKAFAFRQRLLTNRENIDICCNCTE